MVSKILGLRALALVAVTAYFTISVQSLGSCTRETCSQGPVVAYFETTNCTGVPVFYSLPYPWNQCFNDTVNSSSIYRLTETHFENYRYDASGDCGTTGSVTVSSGYKYFFGACNTNVDTRRVDLSSLRIRAMMFLSNVNATYDSPQDFVVDANVPENLAYVATCTSDADCQQRSHYYYTMYTNDTCSIGDVNYYLIANASAYTCFRNSDNYVEYGCQSPHSSEATFFLDGACTRPVYARIDGAECGVNSATYTIHCSASPPTTAPTSASSLHSLDPFLILAAMLAVIF